jgi:chromosome segregation ATPase
MSAQTTIAKLREHNEELLESLGKAYGDISEAVRQRGELAEQNAALLAEVERLRDENAVLLSVKNVTIQTPPITETELVNAAEMAMGQWQLEALRAKQENERLQRERAEWRDRADALMTEQMTQMRDLLAEVEALRARLTLTPEKIEAAAEAAYNQFFDVGDWQDSPQNAEHVCWRGVGNAALLAAGMEAQP